jgi:hypothetical protein
MSYRTVVRSPVRLALSTEHFFRFLFENARLNGSARSRIA